MPRPRTGIDLDRIRRELDSYQFAEVNLVSANTSYVLLKDGKPFKMNYGDRMEIGFRVLENGSWGFSSTNSYNWENALKQAGNLARANPRPLKSKLSEEEAVEDSWRIRPKETLEVGIEDKVARLDELYKNADIPSNVKAVELMLVDAMVTRYYANSQGAFISQFYPRSMLVASATAKSEFVISASERNAGLLGLEVMKGQDDIVERAVKNAVRLLNSEKSPNGKFKVIVDPKMAGVLAHEAVGHACEADEVINDRSVLKGRIGERIGVEDVTIVDDATLPRAFGSYGYDWEGVPAGRSVLVEDGILVGYMHSRETAAELGVKSTGNSRAEDASNFPLVRMSNTFFEAGDWKLDEMMEGMNGIYVHGMKGGVTDPVSGFFQFAAEYGELIENGERTKLLRDITISGNFLEALKKVDAVGNDFDLGTPGFCGKAGQSVPVSDGGPHLRIKEVLLG